MDTTHDLTHLIDVRWWLADCYHSDWGQWRPVSCYQEAEEGEEDLMYDVQSGVRRWLHTVFIITHIVTRIGLREHQQISQQHIKPITREIGITYY